VYVWNNTTVIVDEILSHRLGLVPLNIDPSLISMKAGKLIGSSSYFHYNISFPYVLTDIADMATDRDTVVFKIDITCERNPKAPKGSNKPEEMYINHELLSSHIRWDPVGEQEEIFAGSRPGPTNGNIVLAKLRPGQSVNMEMHAVKGVGKDHAKFSPVGASVLFSSLCS
jgi:DNA-directed RNA polymerase I and III subunit RPAC1